MFASLNYYEQAHSAFAFGINSSDFMFPESDIKHWWPHIKIRPITSHDWKPLEGYAQLI